MSDSRRALLGRPNADAPVSAVESDLTDPFECSSRLASVVDVSTVVGSSLALPPLPPGPTRLSALPALPTNSSPPPIPSPPLPQAPPPALPPVLVERDFAPLPTFVQASLPRSGTSLPPPPRPNSISRPTLPTFPDTATTRTADDEMYTQPRDAPPVPRIRPFSWGLSDVDLLPTSPPPTSGSSCSTEEAPARPLSAWWSSRASLLPPKRPSTRKSSPPKTPVKTASLPPKPAQPKSPVTPNTETQAGQDGSVLKAHAKQATAPPPSFLLPRIPAGAGTSTPSQRSSGTSRISFTPHVEANANHEAESVTDSDRRVAAWLGANASAARLADQVERDSLRREITASTPTSPGFSGSIEDTHHRQDFPYLRGHRALDAALHNSAGSNTFPVVAPRRRPSIYAVLASCDDADPTSGGRIGPWPTPPPRTLPPMRTPPRTRPPPTPPNAPPRPFGAPPPTPPSGGVPRPLGPPRTPPHTRRPSGHVPTPPPPPPSRVYTYPAVASCPHLPGTATPSPRPVSVGSASDGPPSPSLAQLQPSPRSKLQSRSQPSLPFPSRSEPSLPFPSFAPPPPPTGRWNISSFPISVSFSGTSNRSDRSRLPSRPVHTTSVPTPTPRDVEKHAEPPTQLLAHRHSMLWKEYVDRPPPRNKQPWVRAWRVCVAAMLYVLALLGLRRAMIAAKRDSDAEVAIPVYRPDVELDGRSHSPSLHDTIPGPAPGQNPHTPL